MKTVRVKIAVCVNEDGDWMAGGWKTKDWSAEGSIEEFKSQSAETIGPHSCHFVEADIPVPESVTVDGKVTGGAM